MREGDPLLQGRGEFPPPSLLILVNRSIDSLYRSYFAGSVGHVSAATVEKSIAEQKGK
jgi:hypothetical protein